MKKYQLYLWMALTASLFTGCGFRQYEKVEVPAHTSAQLEETVKQGTDRAVPLSQEEGQRTQSIVIEAGGSTSQSGGPGIDEPERTGEEQDTETAAEQPDAEQNRNTSEAESVTMLFGGDVYLSDHVLNAYSRGGGIAGVLDAGYRQEIRDADIFFVNEEFPFSDRGTQAADKQYTFRLPPEKVSIFQEIGIDGVTLANNHALDFGIDALLDSCETLDRAGIPHTGAGADLNAAKQAVTYEVNGQKIAVVGASRVFPEAGWAAGNSHSGMLSAYDPAVLIEQIRSLKKENDVVIAYIHWGIEREEKPNDIQKNLGRQLIDAGADLVIGAHPHVLQGIEYYQGKPIIYSLGNFIFGSSIPRTALLKVTLEPSTGETALQLLPGTSSAGYTHMLETTSQKQEFAQYMTGISFGVNIDADGNVKSQ